MFRRPCGGKVMRVGVAKNKGSEAVCADGATVCFALATPVNNGENNAL
ncbi:MAG: hypothetical protein JWP25_5066 [Bradyrhizobium sp.]|jgi:hypothetical protein|nr:hypothetical protein [Bradyrhizobium sp.]